MSRTQNRSFRIESSGKRSFVGIARRGNSGKIERTHLSVLVESTLPRCCTARTEYLYLQNMRELARQTSSKTPILQERSRNVPHLAIGFPVPAALCGYNECLRQANGMSATKGNKFAKKRPGERKDKCLQVRLRPAEHMAWKALSASLGMTLSDWVREVLNWASGGMVKHNRLEHALRRMGSHRRKNFPYLSKE
jgi:hypothetical protein